MQDETEVELIERARAGEGQAIERLLDRYQGPIYRFSMQMCRHPEDAEDVLQDTLLAVARGIGEFRGDSSISTWLYTIARSFCLRRRRRSKFAPNHERSLDTEVAVEARQLADPAQSLDEALERKRVSQAVERAIDSLDPMYREALVLRDVEGLTAPEVAEVLGVTVQAVKSRLHRARLAVRAQVAPLLGVPAAPAAAGACPDVLTLFSQHLEGEISADVCALMERHIQTCARCRDACDSLKRTLLLCKAAPAAPVPESVQRTVRVAIRGLLAAPPA